MKWVHFQKGHSRRPAPGVRPNILCGRTPSDIAGMKVEGENRWEALIRNVSKRSPLGTNDSGERERHVQDSEANSVR